MNKYLIKLQKKCNMSYEFIEKIDEFLERLLKFEYISNFEKNKYSKKLFNNIDFFITGNKEKLDYKSGYYDAQKKELYIKDTDDLSSVYLRLLYILTTKKVKDGTYITGYSKSNLSTKTYKIDYHFYGINRAVVSNLVCRLLYTTPESLEILPSYRNYTSDFIDRKITTDNNIYYLEGKMLQQLLFVTKVSEETLYENLFKSNPYKRLYKIFKINDLDDILNIFDKLSITYSNYSKLCFFSKLSNKTYMEIRKNYLHKGKKLEKLNILNDNINKQMKHILNKMFDPEDTDTLELSLDEKINELENNILNKLNSYQINLSNIIVNLNYINYLNYSIYLKKFKDILIVNNDIIDNKLYEIITNHLIVYDNTPNLIQKIRYSLTLEFLSGHTISNFLNELSFSVVTDDFQNSKLVLVNTPTFSKLVTLKNLNNKMKHIKNNVELLEGYNLESLLLNRYYKSERLEELYEKVKKIDKKFKNISMGNLTIYNINGTQFICVTIENNYYILGLTKNFELNPLNRSENYKLLK